MKRIGIIGVGGIAQVHIQQLKTCKDAVITAICDINEAALQTTGDALHIDAAHRFSDYNALIACNEVDAVEICTPNHLHVQMALAAVHAGKPIEVEKPLGISYSEALLLSDALQKHPVPNMLCMSYRFRPAVRYAKHLLSQGLLGNLLSVDVQYLKASAFQKDRRLDWRFVKQFAGAGVLFDLGVHLLDLATFLVGDVERVSAHKKIIVKQRKRLESEEYAPVETEDYCSFLAEMTGGVSANFLITRCALGNTNTIRFDLYGDKGMLSFDLNHPDKLGVCIGEVDAETGGLHTVTVPPAYQLGQEQAFIDLLHGKQTDHLPTVQDGVALQKTLDAILLSSETSTWVKI